MNADPAAMEGLVSSNSSHQYPISPTHFLFFPIYFTQLFSVYIFCQYRTPITPLLTLLYLFLILSTIYFIFNFSLFTFPILSYAILHLLNTVCVSFFSILFSPVTIHILRDGVIPRQVRSFKFSLTAALDLKGYLQSLFYVTQILSSPYFNSLDDCFPF